MSAFNPEKQTYINAHLEPWEEAIALFHALIKERPGMATESAKITLSQAEDICSRLKKGEIGIKWRIPGDEFESKAPDGEGKRVKPEAAIRAQSQRESMLRIAIRSLLDRYLRQLTRPIDDKDFDLDLKQLMAQLSNEPLAASWGITLTRVGIPNKSEKNKNGLTYKPTDADSPEAKDYFGHHLRTLFEDLDKLYGSTFCTCLPPNSKTFDCDQWDRIWARAIEAVTLEWLVSMGNGTLRGTRAAVWRWHAFPQLTQRERPAKSHVAIPSGDKSMRFQLLATPVLCQIFEHNPAHWRGFCSHDYSTVEVLMRNLETEKRGDWLYYHGRSLSHIYLIILIQRLAEMSKHFPLEQEMYIPETVSAPPANLSSELANNLTPGQFRTCSALVALCEQQIDHPLTHSTKWFSNAASRQTISSIHDNETRNHWPIDVTYIQARHIVLPFKALGRDENSIGLIRTPWEILGDQTHWVDTTLIVRYENKWSVLPVLLLEDAACAEKDEDQLTDEKEPPKLITFIPEHAQEWPLAELRNAMVRSEWAACRNGLAAFLAGVLDLDRSE